MAYIGRFAPSPTGPMHLGTLTAAVASFLHARQAGGQWLVRIEDIDPPREVEGAADSILRTLEALELDWDGEVRFQSAHLASFRAAADALLAHGAAFHCRCSRRQIRSLTASTRYPGTCRDLALPAGDTAVRLRVGSEPVRYRDELRGKLERDIESTDGDFVIVRRDGLPAYHLAVVVDDAAQGITDIVRGADLLASTPLHVFLQRRLELPTPRYWHIPLVTDADGAKLSKSSGAAAIDMTRPAAMAVRALALLGLGPPADLAGAKPRDAWNWALDKFRIEGLADRPGHCIDDR